MKNTPYQQFLLNKIKPKPKLGFSYVWMPDFLFDFQKHSVEKALYHGRFCLFEDCGLGKTPQQLVWAENVVRKTNKNVLIITPLAVSYQTKLEADKFQIDVRRSKNHIHKGITITNYEQLKNFNPNDFIGVVADESSILKNFDGKTRKNITKFFKTIQYRLLCSATPAPNDYTELGTTAEALGVIKYNQMLSMFFSHKGKTTSQWVLKGHAQKRFWQWVSNWALAIRHPHDLGFSDGSFTLPKLHIKQHRIKTNRKHQGFFPSDVIGLKAHRKETRETIQARAEKVAELATHTKGPFLIWCHLNDEASAIQKLIPDSINVQGNDKSKEKEEKLIGFSKGHFQVLITKPRIGGFGMNWQHCSTMSYFPSYSYEQFYQCVRRCYRFQQKQQVTCHIVQSERENKIANIMMEKERQANKMYQNIIHEIKEYQQTSKPNHSNIIMDTSDMEIPSWINIKI